MIDSIINNIQPAADAIDSVRKHKWSGDAGLALILCAALATVPQRLGAEAVPHVWVAVAGLGLLLSLMSLDLMPDHHGDE